jgi:hypothetical protein
MPLAVGGTSLAVWPPPPVRLCRKLLIGGARSVRRCDAPATHEHPIRLWTDRADWGPMLLPYCAPHVPEHNAQNTGTCRVAYRDTDGEWWLCGAPGKVWPDDPGYGFHFCPEDMPPTMAEHDAEVRARWDAKQAKLPPHMRRTWDQACADEEAHMARALQRAAKDGGP